MLVLHIFSAQISLAICVLLYLSFSFNPWLLWGLTVLGFPFLGLAFLSLLRLRTHDERSGSLAAIYLATKEANSEKR